MITHKNQHRLALRLIAVFAAITPFSTSFAASAWNPTLLVDTDGTSILDDTDTTADVTVQFGDTLSKNLSFERGADRFAFDDALHVGGQLSASGQLIVDQNADSLAVRVDSEATTAAGVQVDIAGDSNSPHLEFGENGVFDVNLYRSFANVLRTDDGFVASQGITGSTLSATGLADCNSVGTDAAGRLDCQVSNTGAYISITTDANATASAAQYDVFEDASYGGSLTFTTNASSNFVFSASNGRFTAGTNGTYVIVWTTYLERSANGLTDFIVDQNGSTIYTKDAFIHAVVDPVERTVTLVREMTAGDYLEFSVNSQDAGTNTVQDGTSVSIGILGRNGGQDGGITQADADFKYVAKAGDTMSGRLNIDIAGSAGDPHLFFGDGAGTFDVNLFREAANILRTSDVFRIDGGLQVVDQVWVQADGTTIFNSGGTAVNFRVAGDTDANALFVQGSTDQVGLGTASPQAKLDVQGSISGASIRIANLLNCSKITTSAAGSFVCDTSSAGSGSLFAQYNDTSGGLDINGATPVAVPWDNEIREDVGFAHDNITNNTRVTLNDAGWYRIHYSVSSNNQSGNRKTIRCRIRMNGTTIINYSNSYSYARDLTDEWQTNVGTALVQTSASNEYYEVICNGEGAEVGTVAALTVADDSWTWVEMPSDSGASGSPPIPELDAVYSEGTGERVIAVDDGSVSWDLSGTNDFVVDILGTGKVGIGTDAPTQTLTVQGGIGVSDLTSCTSVKSDVNGVLSCDTSGTGSHISITTDEDSTAAVGPYDVFEDGSYPGTLDFTQNAVSNITFDQTNGRFTANTTGAYMITINLLTYSSVATATPQDTLDIQVNGVSVYAKNFFVHSVVDPAERTFSIIRDLDAGDFVEFLLTAGVGNQTAANGTTANIVLMGAQGGGGGGGGSTETLDLAYDADSGERTIAVDSGDVSFDLSGGHNFIIDPGTGSGYVGIGTNTPGTTLDVAGGITATGITVNGTDNLFVARSTDGADFSANPRSITWEAEDSEDGQHFSHAANASDITLISTGWYKVSYIISWDQGAQNNRTSLRCYLSDGGVDINGTISYGYGRDDTILDRGSCSGTFVFQNTTASNIVDLRADLELNAVEWNDTSANVVETDSVSIVLEYLGP